MLQHQTFDTQTNAPSLNDDERTLKKLSINLKRNWDQDNSDELDVAAAGFDYQACRNEFWNPEKFSLLYGTPLWDQSSPSQRLLLNHIYWVAYYSQIISAEIATIFFNQTSAAGLYGIEDFRIVCDTLDLESMQERAHIDAFKKVGERFEKEVFGERLFTYPMRGPFVETMIHHNSGKIGQFWKKIQLQAFTLLSSGNAFIGCQYFTVRGVRTLNGKLVQHQLSRLYASHPDRANAPIPAKVSHLHFLDESFHFNSSTIISHDVIRSLKPPTRFEKFIANRGLEGSQKDHFNFSSAINGLFWYDPSLFPVVYKILRSKHFGMEHTEAQQMMEKCFGADHQGLQESAKSRELAIESYQEYLSDLAYVEKDNKTLAHMRKNSVGRHLKTNQKALQRFFHQNHG